MSEFIYLMKNGDLYKLGSTKNLEFEANKLKPGKIVASFRSTDSKSFQARLLRLYKRKRIPETNYFRLSEKEVEECKKHLVGKSNLPKKLSDEFQIGLNGSLLIAILTFLVSFFISKMFIFSLFLSIVFSSLPMWSLAILGSFGGYDLEDLDLFSTVSNRLKGFLIALSMASISYFLYTVFSFSFNSAN
tara:strand:+ start:904 stop:1470 length:567 start_codon:yes stop_codon:yes gene_type:complete